MRHPVCEIHCSTYTPTFLRCNNSALAIVIWYYMNFYILPMSQNVLICTLPAEMFGGSDFWLETRVIIKISKKMIPHMKPKVFFIRKNKTFFFFFKIPNSQYFLVKISWIGPWVRRIDYREGH